MESRKEATEDLLVQLTGGLRSLYEGSVIQRATERAGRNPQLKGHIHEFLIKDRLNARNLLTRNEAWTELTRSPIAGTVDLATVKAGKVIERIQIKDVTSPAQISRLVRQCANGKYRSAQLFGSEETATAFNEAARKAGIAKRMTDSGISSKFTESLAQRGGATGSGTLATAVSNSVKNGGQFGALIGMLTSSVKGGVDLYHGRASGGEVACRVTKATVKGGICGASASAAATLTGASTVAAVSTIGITGIAATAVTVGAPLVIATVVGYGVCKAFDHAEQSLQSWRYPYWATGPHFGFGTNQTQDAAPEVPVEVVMASANRWRKARDGRIHLT